VFFEAGIVEDELVARITLHNAVAFSCACFCHVAGELEQIQFLSGQISVQTTEKCLRRKQQFREAVNDRIGIEPTT
jgi:hypothetical protein